MKLERIRISGGFQIVQNYYYKYDPEPEFSEDKNLYCLTEDISQFFFTYNSLVVDLGWYGDEAENKGLFRIVVIQGRNWENPLLKFESKYQKVIRDELELILHKIHQIEIEPK
jgi:hypothetical protein